MKATACVKMLLISMMTSNLSLPVLGASDRPSKQSRDDAKLAEAVDYAKKQHASSLLVIQRGKVMVDVEWDIKAGSRHRAMSFGGSRDGRIIEDVASIQKSVVSILIGVSDYLPSGWSGAAPKPEVKMTANLHPRENN